MSLAFQDLLAPVTLSAEADPLTTWRWLLGLDAKPWLVTALGDVFVTTDAGRISFLDTHEGRLTQAASANTEWTRALQDKGNVDRWFDPRLVDALRTRGLVLGPEQCYSPLLPLALGGTMAPDNFEVTDWRVHAALHGRIHERVRKEPREN